MDEQQIPTPQEILSVFADKHILYNVSHLIEYLCGALEQANPESNVLEELFNLHGSDWETPAKEAGCVVKSNENYYFEWSDGEYNSWEDLADVYETEQKAYHGYCEFKQIDPHEIEVFEYYIVSEWFFRALVNECEPTARLLGLDVWGRTSCGQAIKMDAVVDRIYRQSQKLA